MLFSWWGAAPATGRRDLILPPKLDLFQYRPRYLCNAIAQARFAAAARRADAVSLPPRPPAFLCAGGVAHRTGTGSIALCRKAVKTIDRERCEHRPVRLFVASVRCGSGFRTAGVRRWIDPSRVSPLRESLQSAVGSPWMPAFTDSCSPGWVADIHLPFSLYPLLLLP